jgi:hypothetical protein
LQTESIWSALYEPAILVVQNKLWGVVGNPGTFSKEVRALSFPPDWKP